ncbi:uncharacterized protein PSFLO_00126 [Pseudozyma flocculosa]|uniref:Uncharacterized protein n=1 Tax=Pseudozyma flocculosa TaxID=84751 RepID=A0A5C3ESH9_9BASI|nr:uncharacterized protein PSFLO_00126 [Pseudozyma flocculosa]
MKATTILASLVALSTSVYAGPSMSRRSPSIEYEPQSSEYYVDVPQVGRVTYHTDGPNANQVCLSTAGATWGFFAEAGPEETFLYPAGKRLWTQRCIGNIPGNSPIAIVIMHGPQNDLHMNLESELAESSVFSGPRRRPSDPAACAATSEIFEDAKTGQRTGYRLPDQWNAGPDGARAMLGSGDQKPAGQSRSLKTFSPIFPLLCLSLFEIDIQFVLDVEVGVVHVLSLTLVAWTSKSPLTQRPCAARGDKASLCMPTVRISRPPEPTVCSFIACDGCCAKHVTA